MLTLLSPSLTFDAFGPGIIQCKPWLKNGDFTHLPQGRPGICQGALGTVSLGWVCVVPTPCQPWRVGAHSGSLLLGCTPATAGLNHNLCIFRFILTPRNLSP